LHLAGGKLRGVLAEDSCRQVLQVVASQYVVELTPSAWAMTAGIKTAAAETGLLI
jgi:hypothetical protein